MASTINATPTSSGLIQSADNSGVLALQTGGTTAVTIDTAQNVGIGTSSPNIAGVSKAVTLNTTNGTSGAIYEIGISGTNYAYLFANASNTVLSSVQSLPLLFNTGNTERMRITSAGNLLVGSSTNSAVNNKLYISDSNFPLGINNSNGGSGAENVRFFNAGTAVGTITTTTVSTLYNTTSDYRLKNVIGSVSDAGERIDALKPIEYDFKAGGRTRGFLAHQFAEVYPTSVSGEKDAIDKEGNPIYQVMQPSTPEVMADLIAEIQSLRKRVAQLEAK